MMEGFLRFLRAKSPEELEMLMTTTDKNGAKHISARFFSDIANALQKCHEMTYAALGDASGDRKLASGAEGAGDKGASAAGIHAAVIAVLNSTATPADSGPTLEVSQSDTVRELGAP
jgi:hypothetical protein